MNGNSWLDRWKDTPDKFIVLIRKINTPDSAHKMGYCVVEIEGPYRKVSRIIEDDQLAEAIALEMIEAGVRTIDVDTELHLLYPNAPPLSQRGIRDIK